MRKVLWLDFILASSTGLVGLLFGDFFSALFGLEVGLIHLISTVHCIYGAFGLTNLVRKALSLLLVRVLIFANSLWALFSVWLVVEYYAGASKLGVFILILQVVVVGGLAIVERKLLREHVKE